MKQHEGTGDDQADLPLGDAPAMPAQSERIPEPLISNEEMDWLHCEDIIIEQQPAITVYRNVREHVVIRAEGSGDNEDQFIFLSTDAAIKALISALQRELRA
jgi:hypothetical protein